MVVSNTWGKDPKRNQTRKLVLGRKPLARANVRRYQVTLFDAAVKDLRHSYARRSIEMIEVFTRAKKKVRLTWSMVGALVLCKQLGTETEMADVDRGVLRESVANTNACRARDQEQETVMGTGLDEKEDGQPRNKRCFTY